MERVFNLPKRSKIILLVILFIIFIVFSVMIIEEYIHDTNDKIIAGTMAVFVASIPTFTFLVIMFFTERREDILVIEENINSLINTEIPKMINNRFLGEPLDPSVNDPAFSLKCKVFHKQREPHAAYRVYCCDLSFEFTFVITVYRVTLFMFVPYLSDDDTLRRRSIDDVCENLINSGFKMFFEHFLPIKDGNTETRAPYTVVYLRRDLEDRLADMIFSSREQYMFGREVTEWCRSVLRKLKYDKETFAVMNVQFTKLESDYIPPAPSFLGGHLKRP